MIREPVVQVLLWLIAAASAVWILGPVFGMAFGRRRIGCRVIAHAAAAEPRAGDADCEHRFRQFVELGFQPVGATEEETWFLTSLHWRWAPPEAHRWLVSPDGRTYVTLTRMVTGDRVRVGATTFFAGGGCAKTVTPRLVTFEPAGPYSFEGAFGVEGESFLAYHDEHVERFRRERGLEIAALPFAEAAREEMAGEKALLLKTSGEGAQALTPLAMFGLPLLMLAPLFVLSGRPLLLYAPLLVCAAAVQYALFRALLLSIHHRSIRSSHDVDLVGEREAAKSDRPVVPGRFEPWVRGLAALGVAQMVVVAGAIVWRVARALLSHDGDGAFRGIFLILAFFAGRGLLARARGVRLKGETTGAGAPWLYWAIVGMTWPIVIGATRASTLANAMFFGTLILAGLAAALERAGRRAP